MATIKKIQTHPNYDLMSLPLERVRDAVKGAVFVKAKGAQYLAPAATVEGQDYKVAQERYQKYLEGAEFDEFCGQTARSMVGKMQLESATVDLDRLDYLVDDVDSDGMSLCGAMSFCADEVLQAKWLLGVADYQGLTGVDTSSLSLADLDALNPRATIKFYSRESVVDWSASHINGTKQLNFVMLHEEGEIFDKESLSREKVESYLILALDDDGNYYQEKLVGKEGSLERGEREYITVNGSPLKFIPCFIFSDEELSGGEFPIELGYLSGLADIAYHKYRVSADQKEAMFYLPPTAFIQAGEMDSVRYAESFKLLNGGRAQVQMGAGCVNVLPDGEVNLVGANTELSHYESYLEKQDSKVRALGGVFQTDDTTEKTAKEAMINSAEQNAVLVGIADSLEAGFKRLVAYCAMFEGLVAQDAVMAYASEVELKLTRDFAAVKLTPEEVRVLRELYESLLFDKEEFVKVLRAGGWIESKAEEFLQRLELLG